MKSDIVHEVSLNDKQIEFLVKCIDISQSTQSLKPDKSEAELIRELTNLNEEIQETKHGNDLVFYDLG
jgi:hypothetical protein|tara:strand:- start:334 stop:537 length:204 start_codon:yes stop_codon:yes gene_type:complete